MNKFNKHLSGVVLLSRTRDWTRRSIEVPSSPMIMWFFPKPGGMEQRLHTLDIHRATLFYLDGTQFFQKSPRISLACAERVRGQAISTLRISNCIIQWIRSCCQLADMQPSKWVYAHSTRAKSIYVVSLVNLLIQDIAAQPPGPPRMRLQNIMPWCREPVMMQDLEDLFCNPFSQRLLVSTAL